MFLLANSKLEGTFIPKKISLVYFKEPLILKGTVNLKYRGDIVKKALLLGLGLAIVANVNAQEEVKKEEIPAVSTQAPRNIYDLMYLPVQGTFFGSTSLVGRSATVNFQYQDRNFLKIESNESVIEQAVGYSFTSTTLAGLNVAYQHDSENENIHGPASTQNGSRSHAAKDKGMKDPAVFMRHRFSEVENDSGRDIDFILSFSPKTGKSVVATTSQEGNAKRGASELLLGLDIGKKTADDAWNVKFSYQMTTKATVSEAGNSANETINDAYGILLGEFKYQFVFSPKFALNLGAGLGVIGKRDQKNIGEEFKNEYDSSGVFTIAADLIFNPTKDISVRFGLKGTGIGEYDLKQTDLSDGSITKLTIEEDSRGEVSLGVGYQF